MQLDDQKKRLLAIGGGVVTFLLVLFFIIRAIFGRGGEEAIPSDIQCSKNGAIATVTWKSKSSDKGLIKYGVQTSGEMPFLDEEQKDPEKVNGGLYAHTVNLESLLTNSSYIVGISGFDEKTVICQDNASAGKGGSSQTTPTTSAPTKAPMTPLPSPVVSSPTPTIVIDSSDSSLLPLVKATSYFNDNPTKTLLDCVKHFSNMSDDSGNSYFGLAHVCSAAWKQVNTSN